MIHTTGQLSWMRLTIAVKQAFCWFLIFAHFVYVVPQPALAEKKAVEKITETHDLLFNLLSEKPNAVPYGMIEHGLARPKGDIGIPDDIPPATEILLELDLEGPKNPSLTHSSEALQLLNTLTPVERQTVDSMLDDTAESSWENYLTWFGGIAPAGLRLQLVLSRGQDLVLEGSGTQLIVQGYGVKGELLGEVVFRLGAELIASGADPTSRDYENLLENFRQEGLFTERWMRTLNPLIFDPLDWARLDYDGATLVRVTPGPLAIAFKQEVTRAVTSSIAQIEGRGPGASSLGLLQVFKNIAPNEDLLCIAGGIGSAALFALAGKLVVWLITRIIIGIIGAVFIAPLIRLFGEAAAVTTAAFQAITAIEAILVQANLFDDLGSAYRRVLRNHMSRLGVLDAEHARLQAFEEKRYRELSKIKLRYLKKIFFVQNLGRIIGWAAAVLAAAVGGYQVWSACKERRDFPARARALAGMEFFIWRNDPTWVRISNVVAAADTDHVTRIVFNTIEEMEPFISRDYLLGMAFLGMGARARMDMGRYPANYANTIDSPRDLVAEAGRYEFGFAGYDSWGYSEYPQRITLLLNMVPLEVNKRSDLHPGSWGYGWIPFDRYYPSGSDSCDLTMRPGRGERGWCELAFSLQRDWETSPLDPSPNVVLRFEFPTVRM